MTAAHRLLGVARTIGDSAVTTAFDEVTRTVDDNAGLAKLVTDPPEGDDWLHELKIDG